ncbi:MAG: YqeG family HAD IIIA-type phosphatase [Coriobacteriia bacterium]|nr:YqeG family HAD IIIA-type phosphatase [Coriobacteriia bacterium]
MELLQPDVRFEKVEDITLEFLASKGYSALILDVDNTLVSRATAAIESSVLAWLEGLKQAGISCCLLSNNWHAVVHDYATELGVPIVAKAMKPLPVAYVKALNTIGAKRASTVVVGDQIFTDILGARLCVIDCILVKPLSSTDLWYTKIFRAVEQRLAD